MRLPDKNFRLGPTSINSTQKIALSVLLVFLFYGRIALAVERVTAVGRVVDVDGKPVEHAVVLVYSAGVKRGFSIFCPTCYVDCGKRTFTDLNGKYSISGLDANLIFDLLVVRDGYGAKFVDHVNPEQEPAVTVVLTKRIPPANPAQIIRGRVLDSKGNPVRDALVEEHGAIFENGGSFGPRGWIDLMAVTNESGDFELAYSKPLIAAIVLASPRAMAPKLSRIHSGTDRTAITVAEGATIRGRLVRNGEPVTQAEIGLSTHSQGTDETLPEVRIGTDDDGRFALTNIPPGRVWYLYAKMGSLASRGLTADIVECATKKDGQDLNIGDISVRRANTLRGRIVLTDGKAIPPDMRLNLFADRIQDSQTVTLAPTGVFEFKGLRRGVYELAPSVKGYEPRDPQSLELLIENDVDDFQALLQPENSR